MAGTKSAWTKDKEIGNILGTVLTAEGEGTVFLLLGGAISAETVETRFGPATKATMLIRKVDERQQPVGPAFEVSTVETAIVEKISNLGDGDLPAFVRYHTVPSKQRGGDPAKVISYLGQPGDDQLDLLDKYGVEANATSDEFAGMGA